MKKYKHIVRGENFSVIDRNCVILVKQWAGKIPQSGMRYIDDHTVLLQSNSAHDILDCVKNQAWAHGTNPSKIQKGWTVYVVPSNKIEEEFGVAAIGVKFTASADVYTDINNQFVWATE